MITSKKDIMNGMWCIDKTRIPVQIIKDCIKEGYSIDDIINEYPFLSKNQVLEAIKFNIKD